MGTRAFPEGVVCHPGAGRFLKQKGKITNKESRD